MLAHEEPTTTAKPAPAAAPARAAAKTANATSEAARHDVTMAPAPAAMAASNPGPAGGRDALAGMLARCVQRRGACAPAAGAGAGRGPAEIPDDELPGATSGGAPASDSEVEAGRGTAVLQRRGTPRGAAPAARPPTDHSIVTTEGPTAGQCGDFAWAVNFRLNRPSIAGGWFVQEISVRRRATDCDNNALPAQRITSHYWEAWRVLPGARQDELVDDGTFTYADRYWIGSSGVNTKGSTRYTANVAFYEGLALPASFIANNPATMAHALPSTTTNPNLRGGTVSHRHNLTGTWNCCPRAGAAAAPSDTVLSRRRPA
jgi:hypothetical protein